MHSSGNRSTLYLIALLLVLTSGFGAVWAYSAEAPYSYMDRDFGQWAAKMQMVKTCHVGDVTVLGDSRASAGIVPRILDQREVVNLALTGSTPIEGYFQVRSILQCPKPPRILLLAYSPSQYEETFWFWAHAARYGFFSFKELEEVRQSELQLGTSFLYHGAFGTEPPGLIKNWLYVNHFPPFNFASMLAARGGRLQANEEIERSTTASNGQHLEGVAACTTQPGWEATQGGFVANRLVEKYLALMLLMAQEHHVEVILLVPPLSEMTSNRLSASFRKQFNSFVTSLTMNYPALGLVGPVLPEAANCDFGDENHLNQQGAEKFSKRLGQMLQAALMD